MFIVLIPFVSLKEVARVLGVDDLFSIIFRRRTS
jgi:hypothetical protein